MRSTRFKRRKAVMVIGAAALAAALLFAAIAAAGSQSPQRSVYAKKKDHYTFVVSNNFLGNDYRPQLLRLAKLTANLPPFKGRVTVKVVESQPTTAAQLADLNNIIRTKPDAILLEPPDPTGVNSAIKRACDAGIVVIDVDQAATEKCAWTVAEDFYHAQYILGEWMGQALKGKGKIFVDDGLAGPDIAKTIEKGFLDGLKFQAPNVKVVAHYQGQFSNAPSQQAVSSLLVGNKDINGISNQGYCSPVENALKSAGLKPLPVTCYGYNGELRQCVVNHWQCGVSTGAPTGIQIAMKTALDILDGKANPPKNVVIKNPEWIYVTNKASFHPKKTFGIPIVQITQRECGAKTPPPGTTCSDLPAGMAMPFTLPQFHVSGLEAAGK
ncbi:MAG TPA: substrate-binding domain-containing protein [Gaiellaceae bacterium]